MLETQLLKALRDIHRARAMLARATDFYDVILLDGDVPLETKKELNDARLACKDHLDSVLAMVFDEDVYKIANFIGRIPNETTDPTKRTR